MQPNVRLFFIHLFLNCITENILSDPKYTLTKKKN